MSSRTKGWRRERLSAHNFSRDADSEGRVDTSQEAAPERLFGSAEHLGVIGYTAETRASRTASP